MRPTISLAMIVKNEEENLPRLFKSIEGCFDEIQIVDTGSTDRTVEVAKSFGANVSHFTWVNDFSAARNFAFSQVKTDYVFWFDADDVLENKEAFIDFRDHSMKYFDYVLAKYNYALDKGGKPIVSFARERIFRMSKKPVWQYFIHEGVKPSPGSHMHYCTNWSVNHMRTDEDMKKDRSRNLNIFEEKKKANLLDGRLTFYYGKELFENQQYDKAFPVLLDSIEKPDIEPHDRVLAIQYAAYTMIVLSDQDSKNKDKYLEKAISLAVSAISLEPRRAEFYAIAGDCYLRLNKIAEAAPFFGAAKYCIGVPHAGSPMAGAIHTFKPLYEDYPRNMLAQILVRMNSLELAKIECREGIERFDSKDSKTLLEEINKLEALTNLDGPKIKTEDIVFTCPPQSAYEFDEELYKTKGMGGSETALIEMAKWLRRMTGRRVIVFNMRERPLISESGVEYLSTSQLNEYFMRFEPKLHIAWRHNIRVTKAPSYLWCHDLMIPGVEHGVNQDKVLALTPFHRDFLSSSQGVSPDRILLTRNGINPDKFNGLDLSKKDPLKFVYSSSPDRGLDRCILILDKVRAAGYDVKLHIFYGLDNLYKYGQAELADKIKAMIEARTWITYHGNTEQRKMYEEWSTASFSLLPNNFIETSMITAKELLACGVYPIIRRWGAVQDTLAEAEKLGMCKMLEIDSATDQEHEIYAQAVIEALSMKHHVSLDMAQSSWEGVARQWMELFDLGENSKENLTLKSSIEMKKEHILLSPIKNKGATIPIDQTINTMEP